MFKSLYDYLAILVLMALARDLKPKYNINTVSGIGKRQTIPHHDGGVTAKESATNEPRPTIAEDINRRFDRQYAFLSRMTIGGALTLRPFRFWMRMANP